MALADISIPVLSDLYNLVLAVFNFLLSIPGTLISLLAALLYLGFYPVISFASMIIGWIVFVLLSFTDLLGAFWSVFNTWLTFFSSMFSSALDATWVLLILAGFGIVVGLRLYYFVKDIEILGFKI